MEAVIYPICSGEFEFELAASLVYEKQSKYQKIEIIETPTFGRALLLDGHIQFTEHDEAAYHEPLVHIPAMGIQRCRRVLIVGGGDGGAAREALKVHPNVQVDLVEIDNAVVEACKKHLPKINNGAFRDKRLNLIIEDAIKFVEAQQYRYDLVVIDSTEFYAGDNGVSEELFGLDFYWKVRHVLLPEGIVVTQADNSIYCPEAVKRTLGHFKKVFNRSGSYHSIVPSFGSFSTFAWASNTAHVGPFPRTAIPDGMRYLNSSTYDLAFNLPFASR